jgi:hypothetical protein
MAWTPRCLNNLLLVDGIGGHLRILLLHQALHGWVLLSEAV